MTAHGIYTPKQDRIFRAVRGAVKNAAHGHPTWKLNDIIAHSIAKRATGTLTAIYWPDVLAAKPSDMAEGRTSPKPACGTLSGGRTQPCSARSRAGAERGTSLRKGVMASKRRSPLRLLHGNVSAMVGPAKSAGQTERVEALIEVLRLIGKLRKDP